MRKVEIINSAFRQDTPREESHEYLQILLDALTQLDLAYLRRHPETPALYKSGVRYVRETPGCEQWLTIPMLLEQGHGDCEDLAAWRTAELKHSGTDARACFRHRRTGPKTITYHIVVCHPNGWVEDPSRVLGMGWDEPKPETRTLIEPSCRIVAAQRGA